VPDDASLGALCAGADLVVVRAATTFRCPGATITLSGAELARGGAAELWRANGTWRIVWARDLRGRRPWSLSDSGG
jgi:competence protein ComEC